MRRLLEFLLSTPVFKDEEVVDTREESNITLLMVVGKGEGSVISEVESSVGC
jgi:hypothetical protein